MMDVNSNVNGLHSEPGFHPEARYEFKVHFDGADFEDLTYRVSFGAPDADGGQPLQLRALTGGQARDDAADGELLLDGHTGEVASAPGIRMWAGRIADAGAAAKYLGDQVTAVVAATGTVGDAAGYGQAVARELFPDMLPYVVGTPAVYSFTGFNGRTQADNAPEAMLSLVAGMAVPSGLRPSGTAGQRASDFPYVVPA